MTADDSTAGPARFLAWSALDAGTIARFVHPTVDLFASHLWFDLLARAAAPPGLAPGCVAIADAVIPVWCRRGRVVGGLSSPYSLVFTPPLGTAPATVGGAFARIARRHGTLRLDALDAAQPGLAPFLDAVAASGIIVQRFSHFGNWHAPVETAEFDAWLATRPGRLRSTITRKLKRARGVTSFSFIDSDAGLAAGISAFEQVYAMSWKQAEPFAAFNAACMRSLADAGLLRLGILATPSGPIAAQYWAVSGGSAMLLKLAHDEAHTALSPGTVLTAQMLAAILARDRPARLDFGRGDDPYKRLWVDQRHERIGALLINPRRPAGVLALVRGQVGALRRRLRKRKDKT
ncbi:GNAT family N-acetyltransferase [Acidiphilium sp. PA]|uniref:GNAT family N-acetyltransferase n=1 Tax=Acidiphilium sp. PA TaxID=2871705 RepID=UPI00224326D9|nr:GNAT family N-acetyltransferase [Acidiphilium sp. PA]MCW8305508.1 GNAT family N-acetyltransferase [Acidiphilium sp. PA]